MADYNRTPIINALTERVDALEAKIVALEAKVAVLEAAKAAVSDTTEPVPTRSALTGRYDSKHPK